MLLARIYEINPLLCSRCGGEMRIIALTYRDVLMLREAGVPGAATTELEPFGRILRHIGEPDSAPGVSPDRWPTGFFLELDQSEAVV